MSKLKAYMAYWDQSDYVTYVHGVTPGKARSMFRRCDPGGEGGDWNDIRLIRRPQWDDRPFVEGEEYNEMFAAPDYDEEGEPLWEFDAIVDCSCKMCRAYWANKANRCPVCRATMPVTEALTVMWDAKYSVAVHIGCAKKWQEEG